MRRASPPPLPGARERSDAGTTRREHPTTLRDVVPAESHDVRGPRAALGDVTLRRRRGRERFIAGEKSTRRSCRACRRAGSRRRRASWIAPRAGSHRGEDLDGRRPTESGGDDGPDLRGARAPDRVILIFFLNTRPLSEEKNICPSPVGATRLPRRLPRYPRSPHSSPTFPPHHRKLRTRRRSSARSAASPSATTPTSRRTTRAWKSFTRSKRRTASSPARSSRTSSSRRTRSGTRTIGDGRTGTKAPRTASRA